MLSWRPRIITATDPRPQADDSRHFREGKLDLTDLLNIALLAAVMAAMFWRILFTSQMLFYRDVFNYTYPYAQFIHQMLRHGQLPYWNPYLDYGEALLANPNFLFFYPFTLVIALLPLPIAFALHFVTHLALGAAGVYILARRWRQSRWAAWLAAAFFGLSGPVISLASFYNHAACAAWIPWALVATDFLLEARSLRAWALLSAVFALQFLAGEPFTLLATFLVCLAYSLWRVWNPRRWFAANHLRIMVIFALTGVAMLALAAVQFLPAAALLRHSRRGTGGLPYGETTYWSLHPFSLLEIVLPDFFGSSIRMPTIWTTVLGCHNLPYFPSLYLGFVPLFLALVGFAAGKRAHRNFAAAASALLFLLALGRFTPAFALAYMLLPPLHLLRSPVKLLVPCYMLVALLAGDGVDILRCARPDLSGWKRRLLSPLDGLLAAVVLIWLLAWAVPQPIERFAAWVLVSTNALFLGYSGKQMSGAEALGGGRYFVQMLRIYFPGLAGFVLGSILWLLAFVRQRSWARWVWIPAAGVGLLQLAATNFSANPVVSKQFYTYTPPVATVAAPVPPPYRFCYIQRDPFTPWASPPTLDFLNFDSLPPAAGFSTLASNAFHDRLVLKRGAMLAQVEVSQNLDLDGSLPPSFYQFWLYALRGVPNLARHDCLLGRTNVLYLIRTSPQASSAAVYAGTIFDGAAQPAALYRDRCYLPRAFTASQALFSMDSNWTLSKLSDPAFDAARTVILWGKNAQSVLTNGQAQGDLTTSTSSQNGIRVKIAADGHPSDSSPGQVTWLERNPNRLVLRARMTRPGYLVLLDRFDEGWHAWVDLKEARILRADHMFMALPLPAGEHVIRFQYRQPGLRAGAAISLVAVALLLLMLWKGYQPISLLQSLPGSHPEE